MQEAKSGDQVSVHYTGKLESGEVFDSSVEREPLSFQVGTGQMIKGFDQGVLGMKVGDKKTLTLSPEEAYGQRDEQNVHSFPKENLKGIEQFEIGQVLPLQNEMGQTFYPKVLEVTDQEVKLDFNHELAGKTLVFDVEMVSIA